MDAEVRRVRNGRHLAAVLLVPLLLLSAPAAEIARADSDAATPGPVERVDTQGAFRIEGSFFGGAGLKDHVVGTAVREGDATDTKDITISGGGGIGGGLTIGYGLGPSFELDVTVSLHESSLSIDVANADGSFPRTAFRGTAKYKIPITAMSLIKLGGGAGYYLPGDLDLDFSDSQGGEHLVFGYDAAAGFHVGGEYEKFVRSDTPTASGSHTTTSRSI